MPRYAYEGERGQLAEWAVKKGDLAAYRREKNARSIDGLPAWSDEDEGLSGK